MKHEGVKVEQDEDGIYLLIPFGNNLDKIYIDEIFEDETELDRLIDIEIKPHLKIRNRPNAFFESLDPKERERIKKDLDLREKYIPPRDDLNLFNYLMKIYKDNPPKLEFKGKTIEDHKKWAPKLLEKVKELSNYNLGRENMDVEEGPETEFKNIVLKKYYFTTAPFLKVPAILAYPKNMKKSMPGIITVHGHNSGKINTIGMLESASNSYYGIDLALRGYVTLSLDQWGWGERIGFNKKREESPEKTFALSALLLGFTAIGIRSWEVSRSIDFLKRFDFVENKFAVIGQSGGGTTAAFSSVLDERIDASVISGYYCTWLDSIFAMNHCVCNFIPGILKYADLPDIMAIRAPKPTFIVSGDRDSIFPQEGVQSAYAKLKKVYEIYNCSENLQIDVIPNTGHVFRGKYAYPWLDKVLLDE